MSVEGREANIYDLDKQDLRRDRSSTPLFQALTTEFESAFSENNLGDDFILENYYVDLREDIRVSNENIFHLLPGPLIKKASDLNANICGKPGLIYLLIGKKGSGKTLTLKYYCQKILNMQVDPVESKRLVFYLNIRTKKRDREFLENLHGSLFLEVFEYIRSNMESIYGYLHDPKKIRLLDPLYNSITDDSELAKWIMDHKREAITYLIEYLLKNNYEIIVVVDNIDDFGEEYVKIILDWCEWLKEQKGVNCIVAVRDHWTQNKLGIEDTHLCAMHLCKPNIKEIIRKRLKLINIKPIEGKLIFEYEKKSITLNTQDIISFFEKLIIELTDHHNKIQGELFELVNYNLREYLDNMLSFFRSPYLYSRPNFSRLVLEKIMEEDKNYHTDLPRPVKFFDFLECFMASKTLCFDIENSKIFNIFYHDGSYNEGYKYTYTYIRILQMAPELGYSPIKKEKIVEQMNSIGYDDESAVQDAISKLLRFSLLESPNGACYREAKYINLSAKGRFYLNKILMEYSYILFICDVVPMEDQFKVDLLQKFGNDEVPLPGGQLSIKHESVKKFVSFLKLEEDDEECGCPKSHQSFLKNKKGGKRTSEAIEFSTESVISKMKTPITKAVPKLISVKPIKKAN